MNTKCHDGLCGTCPWCSAAQRQRALFDAEQRQREEATIEARVKSAIDIIVRFGGIAGDHHKAWVLDQVVRILAAKAYPAVVAEARAGEDGPETYDWDVGIPP